MKNLLAIKNINSHSERGILRVKTLRMTKSEGSHNVIPVIAKAGFTLAEVLITLGIIGVVAAMTIPNLIQNIKDKRHYTQLKATQSILSNAIRLAEEEYGTMDGWFSTRVEKSEQNAKVIMENLRPFLKLALDCGTYDLKGNCVLPYTYKLLNGSMHDAPYHNRREYYKFVLLNGAGIWWRCAEISEYSSNERVAVFWIDVNGPKPPNQVGRDLFIFAYEKGSLRPNGAPGYYQSDTCKLSSTGWGCAYFVLQNRHMKYPK